MTKRIAIILVAALAVMFPVKSSHALSCLMLHGQEAIDAYPIIVKVTSIDSNEKTYGTFAVEKVYKGDISDNEISVPSFLSRHAEPRKYKSGQLYVLFLKRNEKNGELVNRYCSPEIDLSAMEAYPDNFYYKKRTYDLLEAMDESFAHKTFQKVKALFQ